MEKVINGDFYKFIRPGVWEHQSENSSVVVRDFCVPEIIADRRKQLKMTQQDLADKVGVNRSTLSRYESGTYKKISYDILARIAEALDMTEDYLWGRVDDPHEELFPVTAEQNQEQRLLMYYRRLTGDQKNAVENMVKLMGGDSDAGI